MNTPNLQNQRLDRIGRKLLETTQIRSEEIEQIVAAPQLYDSVLTRIKAEQGERKQKNFFDNWRNFSSWNRQRMSVVFTVAAFFVFGAAGLFIIDKFIRISEQAAATAEIQMPVITTETQPTPRIFEYSPEITNVKYSVSTPKKIANQSDFKTKNFKTEKPERKPGSSKKPVPTEKTPNNEFYALAFAGNAGENGEDLRIVRAELSRSSLFALGVNLPIENDSEKIKTDLLVGTDGVARAIRFIE